MNLIDCSYFYVGPLQIENARPIDDLDNNAFAVQETIVAYIERYQGEFLLKMVGKDLAAEVTAYLVNRGKDEEYTDEVLKRFNVGDNITAMVMDVIPQQQKLSLSIKEMKRRDQQSEVAKYMANSDDDDVVTLADLISSREEK